MIDLKLQLESLKVKFVLVLINGEIEEHTFPLEKDIKDLIRDLAYEYDWFGGRFLEICVTAKTNKGEYHFFIDILNSPYNLILG
jgi:hypothetical protein